MENANVYTNITDSKICAICIQPIISPEDEKILHSNHSFHIACATSWLERKSTCPLCREYIPGPESQSNIVMKFWILIIYISHTITIILGVISLVTGYTDYINFNDECKNRYCPTYSLFIRANVGYSFIVCTIAIIWLAVGKPRIRDILTFLAVLSALSFTFMVTGFVLLLYPGFPQYCSPNCSETIWRDNIIWGITMLFSGLPCIPGIIVGVGTVTD